MSLNALIRTYRNTAGLTQHELASRAGLSLAAVRDLEQGRRSRPRGKSLAALSRALGLDLRQDQTLMRAASREQFGVREGSVAHVMGHEKGLCISVLGPLAVWRDGQQVSLGSPARQVILGLLSVAVGVPVQREKLLDLLWGERPPRTATELVQAHVSRLRRELWPAGVRQGEQVLESVGGGYRLRIAGNELDLAAFDDLARRAANARADGEPQLACALYEQAFELNRGDPCENVSLLRDHPAVIELRRHIAKVLLEYAEIASEQGRHDLVLRRLEALTVAEPLNERVHARLMVALAGCGQQAAALRCYEDLRARLDRELGLYPGAELAETHLRLLRQDLTTGRIHTRSQARTPSDAVHLVPRQLPAAARYFTGRCCELSTLTSLFNTPVDSTHAIPVVALTGMAGIGKSALAVYWAHRVAKQFPDGQLFTDLRGFSPNGIPASPAEVIRAFLRALGVDDWRIPADMEGQRALYRSLLAIRRVLIVLDNAQDAEQIRPLLPGAPGCFVLVTSRNRLTGLAASHAAQLLPLDCLTEAESRSLLASGLGETRVQKESRAAGDLIGLCARLPLALCNTIARASAHPDLPLAELAAAMRHAQGRLDSLETGERVTSVRMVFSWSHAKLSRRAERMFHLMAVHPGPDVTVPSAASLTGMARRDAYLALAELSDGHLITEYLPRRYTSHDLIRAYAKEMAWAHETVDERRAAIRRVLDYYLNTASLAARYLLPGRSLLSHRRLRVPLPRASGVLPQEFRSAAEAEAWVRAERNALLAAISQAADEEIVPHAWELPWVAGAFLRGAARWIAMAQALERALITARRLGDTSGQATVHQQLGWLKLRLGAYASAHDHLEAALSLGEELAEPHFIALVRLLMARLLRSECRLPEALVEAQHSLELSESVNDRCGKYRALTEIGWDLKQLGDAGDSAAFRSRACELRRILSQIPE